MYSKHKAYNHVESSQYNNAQETQDFTLGNPLGDKNLSKFLSRIIFKIKYNAKDENLIRFPKR